MIEEDDDIAVEFDTQEEEATAEEDAGIEGELDSWVGDIGEQIYIKLYNCNNLPGGI